MTQFFRPTVRPSVRTYVGEQCIYFKNYYTYILYFVFCILYFVLCTLYFVFCILYFLFFFFLNFSYQWYLNWSSICHAPLLMNVFRSCFLGEGEWGKSPRYTPLASKSPFPQGHHPSDPLQDIFVTYSGNHETSPHTPYKIFIWLFSFLGGTWTFNN